MKARGGLFLTLLFVCLTGGACRSGNSVPPSDLTFVGNTASGGTALEDGSVVRVLFLTHSAGFRHEVLPLAAEIVRRVGPEFGIEAEVSEDVSRLSAGGLEQTDALLMYTTGELPVTAAQKQALLDFVRAGGGLVGVHSATDTFFTWPEFGELMGAYFDGHPWHQKVTVRVEDTAHPATRHLPEKFSITDEIYQFRNFSRDRLQVLLSLDVESVDLSAEGVHRTDGDFALAWTRRYGKGRMFYTALGHREEVWRDRRFQKHLFEGIRWAAK